VLVTGELRRENHELRTELNTAKTALESLSSGDFSGDDSSLHSSAAAAELVRLSKRVAHAEKLIKTKDVLIEGLSEQVGKLRKENEHLAEQVAHLEVNARAKGEMSNAGISSHADLELVKRLQHELKEKNGIIKDLEENIGTITMEKDKVSNEVCDHNEIAVFYIVTPLQAMDVNSQWVTHNKVQEADLVTLREQKSRLEGELEEHQQAHDTRIREVDKVLMSAKTIVDRERQEKLTAQTELKRAKDKCDLLEGKFNMVDEQFKLECTKRQQLEQEVKDMKKQSGNSDNIAVLEQQVQLYKEDFATERHDRERLQAEKEVLQEELNSAHMTIHRQREQVRSLEEALQETRERTMQRDRPVSSNRDRQAAGVVPLSDYDRRMAIEYQRRIEEQIKRQGSQQRHWRPPPGHTESDLVPRGTADSDPVTHDGPSLEAVEPQLSQNGTSDVEKDSVIPDDEQQRLPYSNMTTGSRPVAQPTSESDTESTFSMLGGAQIVTRPSPEPLSLQVPGQWRSGSSSHSSSGPPSLGMLVSKPEDNLKNSISSRQKGRGSLLVCPRCAASFPPKQGKDYIRHVDHCCSQP
jgi:hypothetical protein